MLLPVCTAVCVFDMLGAEMSKKAARVSLFVGQSRYVVDCRIRERIFIARLSNMYEREILILARTKQQD
jgi:hypothetical protein